MGIKINLDDRGRITLPKSIRDKYGLEIGDELVIEESEGEIVIKFKKHEISRTKANINWKNIGFFKTGEISFED
ncbi:MAG: AbrB/MazE/SpoVT family DNA-binding domain-containing protein [Candidatus Hodarchaeales archaeon]|jgi:AbrB family looped-hinge helix DNA binding protein